MGILSPLSRMLEFLTSAEFLWGLLWVGVGIFAIDLLLLMETRWGQTKLIQKCLALSILFHVLLIGYTKTIDIVAPTLASRLAPIRVTFDNRPVVAPGERETADPSPQAHQASGPGRPWEMFSQQPGAAPPTPVATRSSPAKLTPQRTTGSTATELPGELALGNVKLARAVRAEPGKPTVAEPARRDSPSKEAQTLAAPTAQRQEAGQAMVPLTPAPTHPKIAGPALVAPTKLGNADGDVAAVVLDPPARLPRMTITPAASQPPEAVVGPQPSAASHAAPSSSVAGASVSKTTGSEADYAGLSNQRMWTPNGLPTGTKDAGGGTGEAIGALAGPALLPSGAAPAGQPRRPTPEIYKLRTAPDHVQAAEQQGATAATEAAVKAALRWLAQAQAADGRWSAAGHEAGKESRALGRDRPGAGATADTGITGLALLAMLASGHTHRDGEHRDNVRRGLEFLMRAQEADGNLGGNGNIYESMYCHAIATFAMSEALGMTGEPALQPHVRRAIDFTIAAQDLGTGGWRYRPGDPGDTSQLGWQFMALKSAELAGISVPATARQGTIKFLNSVASGENGGLASYRPQERPSRTMTAEALFCWQLLGVEDRHPAVSEATNFLMADLPGRNRPNLYYWYYATLAIYQRQGDHWLRWNHAIQEALVTTQRNNEGTAGSWDPDPIWGGYGGRVYSTALSALCLEVYYRFLPLYKETASRSSLVR
jgi:hypothetical protein